MVVVHQFRVVLVGLAPHEPVVAVEASPERPLVTWASRRHFRCRRQVPLADGQGGVALIAQNFREESVLLRDGGVVARETCGKLDDAGHAIRMVVAAGKQTGPGRRTQGGRVEVGVAAPLRRQAVERRRCDVRSIRPELGVSHVVQENDHHVRGSRGRRLQRRPPALRIGKGPTDMSFKSLCHSRSG